MNEIKDLDYFNFLKTEKICTDIGYDLSTIDFLMRQISNFNEIKKQLTIDFNLLTKFQTRCKISCIILTFNEERCIERCIKSVINSFDEIIIIDSGSTDNTILIINKFTLQKVHLFSYKWENDFSKARNFGIIKAKYDWVIFIDADEELNNEAKYSLKNLINLFNYCEQKANITMAFTIKEREKNNIYEDIPRILFRQGNCKYYGMVHEEIRCDCGELILVKLKSVLYHDGYNELIVSKKNKVIRNLTLLRLMMKLEPDNLRWLYFYIRDGKNIFSYNYITNNIKKYILIEINKDICFCNIKKSPYVFEILLLYCEILQRHQKFQILIDITTNLLEIFPSNYDFAYYNTLSKVLKIKSEFNDIYLDVINFRKNNYNLQNSNIDNTGYHIDLLIALLLFENGQYNLSKKYFIFINNKLKDKINCDIIHEYLILLKDITL